ncbi:hypothetical protein SLOPH_2562, partial [Spraguea lophii 42_110]
FYYSNRKIQQKNIFYFLIRRLKKLLTRLRIIPKKSNIDYNCNILDEIKTATLYLNFDFKIQENLIHRTVKRIDSLYGKIDELIKFHNGVIVEKKFCAILAYFPTVSQAINFYFDLNAFLEKKFDIISYKGSIFCVVNINDIKKEIKKSSRFLEIPSKKDLFFSKLATEKLKREETNYETEMLGYFALKGFSSIPIPIYKIK